MRNRSISFVLTFAAVVLPLWLSGCALVGAAARAVVEPPRVTFDRLSLEALDLDGLTLGLNWKVVNPNDFPFRLSRLGWALELDGRHAARGDSAKGIDIPAAGGAAVALPVRIRWADVPGLLRIATNRDALPFRVTGTAAVGSTFGDIDVPFSREGTLTLPRDFGLQGFSAF